MSRTSVAQRIGRALVAATFAVAAVSLTSPGTAYAKHGNGAAIALGILGATIAGAAIASSAAPGYYAASPTYYYPYSPPQAYVTVPAPGYYYAPPPAAYYGPTPYYGSLYYYSGY